MTKCNIEKLKSNRKPKHSNKKSNFRKTKTVDKLINKNPILSEMVDNTIKIGLSNKNQNGFGN